MTRYVYTHTATEATTGYFSCEPEPRPSLEEGLNSLTERPLDDFLRRHLIARLAALGGGEAGALLAAFAERRTLPAPVTALIRELVLLNPAFAAEHALFHAITAGDGDAVSSATSLIFLRWQAVPDHEAHRRWSGALSANLVDHRALKAPEAMDLPPLDHSGGPGGSPAFTAPFPVSLADLHGEFAPRFGSEPPHVRPPSAETAALAEERLAALGIIAGREMRHTASLSPVGLLRPWNVRLSVKRGRHAFTLEGTATTYGRGLAVADARASCLMEMAERASAYLSVDENGIPGLASPAPVREARRSVLLAEGENVLNPDDFPLEAPYRDQPVLWMRGHGADRAPVWIPVQMASLFCNLDEIALFDSPGSTGIATGRSMEEAKVAALLEIAERDAESTTPFSKASCFTVEADDDPLLAALLADYKARGINVQFQDMTGPLGIPVYKCFVMGLKGRIAAGHGAGLSGRRALVSALTETPFPYPDGGPSGPLLRKLPVRRLGELPDHSLPTPNANLAMLEALFTRNGRPPAYADITREDIGFPVVRAFVPGMELAADAGDFSRVPFRLYANYLAMAGG